MNYMRPKLIAGALYAALLCMAALAFGEEPKGFRDVPWGTSEKTLRSRISIQSCDVIDPAIEFGSRRCRASRGITFGEIAPHAVFFYFRNDMLVAWQVITPPRLREQVAKSLIAQYGQPTIVYADDHATWTGQTTDLDFVGTAGQDRVIAVTKAELVAHEFERDHARRSPK
jgi:hypothetical protein